MPVEPEKRNNCKSEGIFVPYYTNSYIKDEHKNRMKGVFK